MEAGPKTDLEVDSPAHPSRLVNNKTVPSLDSGVYSRCEPGIACAGTGQEGKVVGI